MHKLFLFLLIAAAGSNAFSETLSRSECKAVPTIEGGTQGEQLKTEDAAIATVMNHEWRATSPRCVAAAIRVLTPYSTARAIPALIDALDFKIEPNVARRVIPAESYPAIGALIYRGKQALPALVGVLREQGAETIKGKNALETIGFIFSDARDQAISYLRAAADEQHNDRAAINLYKAIDVACGAWCKTPACNHPESLIKPD
jgi:hypothetical protein